MRRNKQAEKNNMLVNVSEKRNSNRGMTMAEMLIVVAIIIVLAGVAFIAVYNHQRSMAQLERDNIAREIFVAAQNHLNMTAGESMKRRVSEDSYIDVGKFYKETNADINKRSDDDKNALRRFFGEFDTEDGINYIVVNNGQAAGGIGENMLERMLPFGSIEENVRGGGSYIIRYQRTTGTIKDVFYCSATGSPSRFNHTFFDGDQYSDVIQLRDVYNEAGTLETNHKDDRRTYVKGGNSVLGWYGGEGLETMEGSFEEPTLEVINSAKLIVRVKDKNKKYSLNGGQMKLIVTGVSSGAQKSFNLTWATSKNVTYTEATSVNNSQDNNDGENVSGETDPDNEPAVTPDIGGNNTEDILPAVGGGESYDIHDVVLDDITTDEYRFSRLFAFESNPTIGGKVIQGKRMVMGVQTPLWFIPGEDITVRAVAYNSEKLANIAYSNEVTTNSLFDSIDIKPGTYDGGPITNPLKNRAVISNIRHLENLDTTISDLKNITGLLTIKYAIQTDNLIWKDNVSEQAEQDEKDFVSQIGNDDLQIIWNEELTKKETYNGSYKPVNLAANFEYDGDKHSISGVNIIYEGDAGLFGTLPSGSKVQNLELTDFSVSGTGTRIEDELGKTTFINHSAGSLAGKAEAATITNVIARNTATNGYGKLTADDYSLETADLIASGSAGGLIGSAVNCKVEYSASALVVTGNTSAGGLIGETSGEGEIDCEIDCCYAGGHTEEGEYYKHKTENNIRVRDTEHPIFNIKATGIAGGLIGVAGDSKITNSYATSSVEGIGTAGGFVGTASGEISNCYATGLVSGDYTDDGELINNAFVGSYTNNSLDNLKNNYYCSIINEVEKKDEDGNVTMVEYKKSGVMQGEQAEGSDSADDSETELDDVPNKITPFDIAENQINENSEIYKVYVRDPDDWKTAGAYDTYLKTHYNGKYIMKNVDQLTGIRVVVEGEEGSEGVDPIEAVEDYVAEYFKYYVIRHYGDWPAPEIFFINQ